MSIRRVCHGFAASVILGPVRAGVSFLLFISAVFPVVLPAAVQAADSSATQVSVTSPQGLMARYSELTAKADSADRLYRQGEERARFCFNCHGTDGNSTRDHIPNLAAQNPVYLFTQFAYFASGRRSNYVMSKLAPELSGDEQIAIALYFSEQSVKPRAEGQDLGVVPQPRGRQLYESMCFACHGDDGHGNEQIPRIAGQPYTFLLNTLQSFHRNDESRRDSPMVSVIRNLQEDDLSAVASWVARMR